MLPFDEEGWLWDLLNILFWLSMLLILFTILIGLNGGCDEVQRLRQIEQSKQIRLVEPTA